MAKSGATKLFSSEKETEQMTVLKESDLRFEKILSSGAFGDVWKGVYKRGEQEQPVAIKVLKGSALTYSKQELKEFQDEILVNGMVDSPYVVHYIGIVLDPLYFGKFRCLTI